jgi:hypothetical protein
MNRRILTTAAALGATLALGVPTAFGSGEPLRDHGDANQAKLAVQPLAIEIIRDHGDATQAKLELQSPPMEVIRDHGDATQAKLAWLSSPVVVRENIQRIVPQSSPVVIGDHGDATRAKFVAQSSSTSVGELESTSGSDINWSQLAIGLGAVLFLVAGVILAVQFARNQRLAH